jgi:PAS domain S-box-containing protein
MESSPGYPVDIKDEKFLNVLADAYQLQEAILGTTELSIISTDINGIITSFNRAAEILLGYSATEVINQCSILKFHDANEVKARAEVLSIELNTTIEPTFEAFIAKAKATRNADRHQWTYIHKNGHRFPVLLSVSSLVDERGILLGYVGIATDITEQLIAENVLQHMAEENARIFNNSIAYNCIFTLDFYIKKFNPVWDNLGWTSEELKSNHLTYFIHPDEYEIVNQRMEGLNNGKKFSNFESRFKCADGTFRWFLWVTAPDLERKIVYASAIDISDRKKSEEELIHSNHGLELMAAELQEQNRQLDEFAHVVSHNLRSPIGNIKALIGLLNENSTLEEFKMIFEKLQNVSTNLTETMNELLETIRIKKNVVDMVPIRFKDMLDKVIQSLEGDLIQSHATVTFDFNEVAQIEYSKAYLESIFQNLISNAIKYRARSRNPEIHISSHLVNNRVELRIADNGLGIDLDRYGDKIFGLHKTFHENKDARGVGLFLTKTQIETLGGKVIVKSEVNVGTTFIIQF